MIYALIATNALTLCILCIYAAKLHAARKTIEYMRNRSVSANDQIAALVERNTALNNVLNREVASANQERNRRWLTRRKIPHQSLLLTATK